ncbi:DPP IV N-terminal domain-containing protein [Bacteroides sp. 519]|uniref:S9 family peptidase n=1 Tax=Bacteroides sp. 519 TaxID=2302937 RepID=UPI0013D340E1|nr:DPP IV N-terminal domain-containing protein [Bacteroides sp. 519]NDV60377.1 S9 family peptidase [Bacteroides sp. 519]
MKKALLTLIIALMAGNIQAQLHLPTLEELIPGGSQYKFAENIYGLQWWGDICIKPETDKVISINPATGKEKVLFTLADVNKKLKALDINPISHLYNIRFLWADQTKILISYPDKYVVYDFKKNEVTNIRKINSNKANNKDYEYKSGNLAYTVGNNLYVNNEAITNEPEGVVCGQSVHRNEFGINKGTFWSPKGNLLAFYRMDERMVTQYPLVDITTRIAEVNNVRYPMAGTTSHLVTIGIYNPSTKETVFLKVGDPTDRYFTNICWSPDEKSLYLIEVNRDQNKAKLCRYDAKTGELQKILFEETHPKYIEPQSPIAFLPWAPDRFIYQSQNDGFNHLYLYNTDGDLLKQITSGSWLVKNIIGFDSSWEEVIIASTEYSPLQTNYFRVNTNTGKRTPIGNDEGVHNCKLSHSGSYVIDTYSTPQTPRKIEIINVRGGQSGITLLEASNPYKNYDMPHFETGVIKADDEITDLYYRITKPADFDATKKYPVIVYVYGGPHAQMVTNSWQYGARGWDIYMANKGYIMFTIDNRGSSNRGLYFENCTFRQLGIEEGKDQVKGIEYLRSLPYVDANRIGVHGWSYGGHMTTALMLRYPNIFKVGVAGGPVIDWQYYEVMYGERYMDTPQSNPEGYKESNLNNLAGNLKGHLLIIHDDHDDTCVPQHALSFMKACVDARTYPDLFIYPGHKHNVMGRDRVHLHEKITRYFEDHL